MKKENIFLISFLIIFIIFISGCVQEDIPIPQEKPILDDISVPEDIPIPQEKPILDDISVPEDKPILDDISVPEDKPIPEDISVPEDKPIPKDKPIPEETQFTDSGLKLGISFPPVGNDQEREFTLQHLKTLNANLIRNSIHWKFREPEKGNFNWKNDDNRIDFFNNNGISLLLTVESDGPDWACSLRNEKSCVYNNEEDFRNFVNAFITRYKGKIDKIQFGNEWDNNFWYVGTAEEFTTFNNILFEEVKKISPETKVVLGGLTKWPLLVSAGCEGTLDSIQTNDNYYCNPELTSCVGEFRNIPEGCQTEEVINILDRVNYVLENANYDIVDIHLYDDVENWPIYYGAIKNKVSKPIIVTEFGGPYVDNCNSDYSRCGLYLYSLLLIFIKNLGFIH